MIQHLSITSGVPMPGVNTSNIPLHPRKEDFKHIRFWANKPWQKLRNNVKSDNLKLPIFSMFMENKFGREISEDIKDTLCRDLRSYWSDIHDSGEILYNYTELGHHRKEHFRMTFESKCQGITPSNSKGGLPAPEAGARAEEEGIRVKIDLTPSRSEDLQDKAEPQAVGLTQPPRESRRERDQETPLRWKQRVGVTPSH